MKNKNLNPSALPLFKETTIDIEKPSHEFGGVWTQEKLSKLAQYLQQFTTVFKNSSWAKTVYIDAYAGSGVCDITTDRGKFSIAGSAKLALDTVPEFAEVIFIEQDKNRFKQLTKLKEEFPEANIDIYKGDCNELLPSILKNKLTKNHRGVIFVDPYGMNISWSVLEQIAKTKKLDVWYLFPLSGFYRQAAIKRGSVSKDKEASIENLLGDSNWEAELYENSPIQDMFEQRNELVRTADVNQIVSFITKRLETIFPYVSEPLILPNKGIRRFAFYFAISNNSLPAQALAKRISSHILKVAG